MLSLCQISLTGAFWLFVSQGDTTISSAVFSFLQVIFSALFVAISTSILSRQEFQLIFVRVNQAPVVQKMEMLSIG